MELQEDYLAKAQELFPPSSPYLEPIVIESGQGSYVYDVNGKRYIDFTTGIAIAPIGHCHAKVVEAINQQSQKLVSSMNFLWEKTKIELADKLINVLPTNLDSVFLCNSGTEAIEGAIKLVRKAQPGRSNFIAFNGGFHGRTMGALSVTASKASYRADYFPLLPSTHFVDYPQKGISTDKVMEQLDKLFEHSCPPSSVAAIFVESILGEGGYHVPPKDFLPRLRQLCDRWEILLVVDEIQSGFGRTGKWFACEHSGVQPDIMAFAKGIASGLPLGGFAANNQLMSKLNPGAHGSTFGGNPISCAAAIATLKVIDQERLMERAASKGRQIRDRIRAKFGNYLDVRGEGFMIAIEPKSSFLNVKSILNRAQSKGVLALNCGSNGNTIRLIPALNIPDEVLEEGLSIFEQIFDYEILVAEECDKYRSKETV
ncbi:MAG: aminotransferase class III-fold pyridoxal phosphate-dependent enzyme [Candidatus Caenarcaniphilales bacterium]|nr:aminotransferase class III-fold pyridoxal phosphate-dependent enzyme [Candidatus Caenarcaniphilales bacterium]